MGPLVKELVQHNETYEGMVNEIGLGETKVARKLVEAMNDNHMNFMQEMGLMMGESVNAPVNQRGFGRPPQPHAQPTGEPDGQQPDDQQAATMIQDPPGDGTDAVDQVPPDEDAQQNSPTAKLNKEFAYHHMMKEMAKYPHMQEVMKEMCRG
jgi:hypothetical protein